MDFLTKLSIKRPVSTFLVLLALIVFGFSSITGFELESTPEMNMPMLMVNTRYEGADPETVDELVTDKIEALGTKLEGLDQSMSRSMDGMSMVMFQFDYDVDIDQTYSDLKTSLDSVRLPDECDTPSVMEMQMDSSSIMTIQVRSDKDVDILSYVNDTVSDKLTALTGVADVDIMGGSEDYIQVTLNERNMNQYGVTMDTVAQYIAAADYTVPADSVRQGSQDISLTSTSDVDNMASLLDIPIKTQKGSVITLRDIATVSYAQKESQNISRHNGASNVSIQVSKKQSASAVTVSKQVKAAIEELEQANPDYIFDITSDTADDITDSLISIAETLAIGIILSMVTLFLFFGDFKASLIVGSSMPISLLATLILMSFAGFTLNIISMGALVIAIGMMVDSSIVVLESCFRARDKGLPFQEAALEGTKEVTASIVASTITTVVVYLPLSLMSGMSGQLFKQLGYTIIFAMLSSLVAALTLIPLFFAVFKPVERKNAPAVKVMNVISKAYAKAVRKVIPKKKTAVVVALFFVAIAIWCASNTNMELMASNDEGQFNVTIDTRTGTALDKVDEIAQKYEQVIGSDPDIESYDTRIQDSEATITAYIADASGKTTTQKVDEYSELWSHESGADVSVEAGGQMRNFSSSGASVTLDGTDYDELKTAVHQVEKAMADVPGVLSVTSELGSGSTEARIVIDNKKAMTIGLTPSQIATVVSNVNGGVTAMTIKSGGEEYDVDISYPEGTYDDLNSIMNVKLTTTSGKSVPLSDVASLSYEEAAQTIRRSDGVYSIEISATTADADKFTVQNEVKQMVATMDLGQTVSIGENSMNRMMNDEFGSLGKAIATAIFLVFLVMAMQFESPRFSFMVMVSLPFSMVGSFGLLYLTNATISMQSLMGLLMLVGIVVNNGILYVDTANMLNENMPIEEALATSGEIRLRPILMTTLTDILSMVPMAVGWGSGTEMLQGMGVIIIGGLTASTILILFLQPAFYMLFMSKKAKERDRQRFADMEGIEIIDE